MFSSAHNAKHFSQMPSTQYKPRTYSTLCYTVIIAVLIMHKSIFFTAAYRWFTAVCVIFSLLSNWHNLIFISSQYCFQCYSLHKSSIMGWLLRGASSAASDSDLQFAVVLYAYRLWYNVMQLARKMYMCSMQSLRDLNLCLL
jgi:hypothetical protein